MHQVYVFGPHAHVSAPAALHAALEEAFPSVRCELGQTLTLMGDARRVIECATHTGRPVAPETYQQLVSFARGFVAGFARSVPNPNPPRHATVPSTPAAKRKSDPPAAPITERTPTRRPTLIGLAPACLEQLRAR